MIREWLSRWFGAGSGARRAAVDSGPADKRRGGRLRLNLSSENGAGLHLDTGGDFAGATATVTLLKSKSLFVVALVLPLVMGLATPAGAATISLGSFSFDQLIPPVPGDPDSVGTNTFNILNSTGDFANPFDPGVPSNPINAISFLNAVLALTRSDGSIESVSIGTIAPGPLDDGLGNPFFGLQFADTFSFKSAVFTATLSVLDFLLADGSTFHAATPDLRFTLAAGPLGFIEPNPPAIPLSSEPFDLSDEVTPPSTSVPEPSVVLLFGAGLGLMLLGARKRAIRRS
jgi:hypothetical protein